jgi:multimeric flavodoxin WrbA
MKVVLFNGSPRTKGNTFHLLSAVMTELKSEGISTELVQLSKHKPEPCLACYKCMKKKDLKCHGVKNDDLNDLLAKIIEADAVVIGSPTWFANVSGYVKNLIDRVGLVTRVNDNALNRKVGAAVVSMRRAGGIAVFDAINHFFLINGMIVPGSSYWNIGVGRDPGDVAKDEEGMATMTTLGKNLAFLLKKMKG